MNNNGNGESVYFSFGQNWGRFLSLLNENRIKNAEQSLAEMFQLETFLGRAFLDIGSGSGLFSLAARRLGARVYSFDYDQDSVDCTNELRQRYFPDDQYWRVERGSILDKTYLQSLGQFDLVYSWGVLHHTGAMWPALENVLIPLKPDGQLYIALYNDQGWASRFWTWIKKTYNQTPIPIRWLVLFMSFIRLWGPTLARDLLKAKPFHSWRHYDSRRGMSPWHDLVDWVGGYPFETARPEVVIDFYQRYGLRLKKVKTCGQGRGCNEFVFFAESRPY
jgi:SAM-dependent methyltransferase